MIARLPFESRKLILENTFAIKEEFSNNDDTSWAVQELKNQGLKRLFKPIASTTYERLVRVFYEHLSYDCSRPDILVSSIDGREVEVTIADVTAVLKCSHADVPWIDCSSMLTLEDIIFNMCEGQYADKHQNVSSKAKIPQNIWFVDVVLYRKVCPSGHKTQRRDVFLSALYVFHKGFWCSIPEIIWQQIYKFWEGVHHRVAEHTRTWGLPFPFLITHILRKKRIKGNATDGPITESPHFSHIQWNQSCSHMPKATPKPEPEPMDIQEMAAEQESAAEPQRAAEKEEQPEEEEEKYEETITLKAFYALQHTLEDIQFQIANIQRDARQDRLETQDMLRAILDRLPPAQ
jgi:hypothetical protein